MDVNTHPWGFLLWYEKCLMVKHKLHWVEFTFWRNGYDLWLSYILDDLDERIGGWFLGGRQFLGFGNEYPNLYST